MSTIYHIRRPLLKARGNSFYRDKSFRGQGTFCGAPEGYKDITHKAKAVNWKDYDGNEYTPCPDCLKARPMKEEVTPMIFNDQPDVEKLNELLEDILARPFTSSFIAVNAIRAALDLFGITLPKLEIEQDIEKPSTIAALTMLHAGKRIPPRDTDCEYAFKLTPAHTNPDDVSETDGLYLYMVIDLNTDTGHYEAYATIVGEDDLDRLINMDVPDMEHDYPDQVGDDSGETKYDQRIRHVNTNGGDDGLEKG